MNRILLLVLGLAALLLVAYQVVSFTSARQVTLNERNSGVSEVVPDAQLEDGTASPAAQPSQAEKQYSLAEIAKHSTETDCWFAIGGSVYDVTQFIASSKHPGGKAIVQGCGKDATTLFETRPMGSGTPHSENARTTMVNFKIGNLEQ